MRTMILVAALSGAAFAAPKVECTAPKGQKKKVDALRDERTDDPFYVYAVKAGGEPVRCDGRVGKDHFDSKLTLAWKDGSTLTFEMLPPEGGTRLYRSATPILDVANVMKLLRKEVDGADWKKHDDDHDPKEPNVVTETYFVPDTNTRAVLVKRGAALVGFGDGFAE